MIAAYHQCCANLIERGGGFVAKYMGDGVLGYFGYPQAHEHDAERAVRAGLAIVEAAPRLQTSAGVPLHVLAGIATGRWSLEQVDAMWRESARYEPAMDKDEREALLSDWRRALDRAKGWASPEPGKEEP